MEFYERRNFIRRLRLCHKLTIVNALQTFTIKLVTLMVVVNGNISFDIIELTDKSNIFTLIILDIRVKKNS